MAKKNDRIVVKLIDKEPDEDGNPCTPSIYWTIRNKRNGGKLELNKYNAVKKKHTLHTEAKS